MVLTKKEMDSVVTATGERSSARAVSILLLILSLFNNKTIMAQADGPSQVVRGEVVDGDNQIPLPGVNVVVVGTVPLLGSTTNADGRFVLANVPLGRHSLRFSFVGYESVVLPEVLVGAGKEVVLRVALREHVIEGQEVVVTPGTEKGQPLNDMAAVSARAFSVEDTRRYAGGVDDPARMASAFAGVVSTGSVQENALVIRGNAPKGVQWRLEGVEIPNPNHFGGLAVTGGGGLTLFSAQLLSDSDVFIGAFPAEYGNALSGVFDMNFRSGNAARREYGLQFGLLGIEGAAEGPFRNGGEATYLANYRYSTIGLLMPLLPTDALTSYQDLSYKISIPTRQLGRFEAWGIGGLDLQDMSPQRDSTQWEYDFWDRTDYRLRMGVGAAGLSHQAILGSRTYVRTTTAVTGERVSWAEDRISDSLLVAPRFRLRNNRARLSLGSFLNHKFSPAHVNRSGVSVQHLWYDHQVDSAPENVPPLMTISDGSGSAYLTEAYTQSRVRFGPRIVVTAGVHAIYFNLPHELLLEPRVGVRWQLGERNAVSAGLGFHSQAEDLRFYFITREGRGGTARPNENLGLTRSRHLVIGYERAVGDAMRAAIEVYHQFMFAVPVGRDSLVSLLNFDQDWLFDSELVNDGSGRNYGLEWTLERFLQRGYYFLVTGSLFDASYRDADGTWRRSRFDQGYALNGLAGREFHLSGGRRVLGLNTRLMAVGGKWRYPIDEAASRAVERVVYLGDSPFALQEPGMWVLDLTATYRINGRRRAQVWALQVKNVLGAKDRTYDYNFRRRRVELVREGYPLPVLSYKIEF